MKETYRHRKRCILFCCRLSHQQRCRSLHLQRPRQMPFPWQLGKVQREEKLQLQRRPPLDRHSEATTTEKDSWSRERTFRLIYVSRLWDENTFFVFQGSEHRGAKMKFGVAMMSRLHINRPFRWNKAYYSLWSSATTWKDIPLECPMHKIWRCV